MELDKELQNLKQAGEAPEWMTFAGYVTISKGYRLKGETPKGMYQRVASSAANSLYQDTDQVLGFTKQQMTDIFFQAMWKNWLCPASPVL